MYLVEAETRSRPQESEAPVSTPQEAKLPGGRWQDFPHSTISHHGQPCCDVAREWVIAMDFAQLNGGRLESGPRWLRQKYSWGPTQWPAYWCELVKRKEIDCGAHAALAHEVFRARGLTSFPAQLIQQYSEDATSQWHGKWTKEDISCHWIDGATIYHEGAALLLLGDDEIKLWDASAGAWINPRQSAGYGSLAAVRVFAEARSRFRWGERLIAANEWIAI